MKNKSIKCENFGQGLNNKNMVPWKKFNVNTSILGPHYQQVFENEVFPAQMKVNFLVPEKSGSQVPLLKLQLSPTIMMAIDSCFLWVISTHFQLEGVQIFDIKWILPTLPAHESVHKLRYCVHHQYSCT